ncbi:hypothetical protein XH87_33640 [Bradyrhizobium sp. CCBAU 53415]|nr:hypothetical protein [Bradyrhizobium sp. CCBAU 53415]
MAGGARGKRWEASYPLICRFCPRGDLSVMPGLVPGIYDHLSHLTQKTWMAGTSPAMTMWGIL